MVLSPCTACTTVCSSVLLAVLLVSMAYKETCCQFLSDLGSFRYSGRFVYRDTRLLSDVFVVTTMIMLPESYLGTLHIHVITVPSCKGIRTSYIDVLKEVFFVALLQTFAEMY